MPHIKLSPDLKRVDSHMPEDRETVEERRGDLLRDIERHLLLFQRYFRTPRQLKTELRIISGEITRHVRTTKDRYGEIRLNLFMLNKSMEIYGKKVLAFAPRQSRTFNEYTVKRTLKILNLLDKLHEDYAADFKEDLQKLGSAIAENPIMMKTATGAGLNLEKLSFKSC